MTKAKYCQFLLRHRGRGVPLYLFLGGKWIIFKVILAAMGIVALISDDSKVQVVGGLILGYTLGKTITEFMSYLSTKQRWSYADDLFNWDRVKEQADHDT